MKIKTERILELWENNKRIDNLTPELIKMVNESLEKNCNTFNNGKGSYYLIVIKEKISIEEQLNLNVKEKLKKK